MAFARALGTSAPRLSTYLTGDTRPSAQFLLRARRLGRALGAAVARGLMSAPVTAAAMREYFLVDEVEWIWRMLLQGRDHLAFIAEERDQVLLDAWEAEPGTVGSAEWDACWPRSPPTSSRPLVSRRRRGRCGSRWLTRGCRPTRSSVPTVSEPRRRSGSAVKTSMYPHATW